MRKGMPTERAYEIEAVHEYGIDDKQRAIFVWPDEPEYEVDELMAAKFLRNIKLLEAVSDDPITVHMMTCGGSWDYGMTMFDAIKMSKCHITTISYSWARSMSSIIPQAADHRIIMPNCSFMAHYGGDGADLHAIAFQSYAEFSKRANEKMVEIYADRCQHGDAYEGMTLASVKRAIKGKLERKVDWWLTADEAVAYGFMDEVLEP